MTESLRLQTPPASNGVLEYRAAVDLFTLPFRMTQLSCSRTENVGQGRRVCVLPGFGAGDRSMYPMRYFLERHGFKTLGWGLGINRAGMDVPHDPQTVSWVTEVPMPYNGEAGVPHLCDLMVERIKASHEEHGEQITLVGWSLGGTIAREVARDLPEIVDHVVTLGSPLIGGPKYTAAAPMMARRGLNLDWIEQQTMRRNEIPLKCKASAIFSPTDGVVDVSASQIPEDDNTQYIERNVSHLGMGINGEILDAVLEARRS